MASSSKIDDFRARLKAEPKGRHFFPLAEELRKAGSLAEAEQTLRDGLQLHPNYLSAWVSLGRVLRDGGKPREAIDALQKALALDANNAVTARLMAETYLSMGEKVEAIKKFKLVNALLPDAELQEQIQALDDELNPPAQSPPAVVQDEIPVEVPAVPAEQTPPVSEPQVGEQAVLSDSGLDEAAALLGGVSAPEPSIPFEQNEVIADSHAEEENVPAFEVSHPEEEVDPFDEPEAFPHSASTDTEPSPFDETGTNKARASSVRLPTLDEPFGGAFEGDEVAPLAAAHHDDDPFGQTQPRPHLAPVPDNHLEESPSVASSFTAGESGRSEIIVKRLEHWLAKVKR